MLWLIWLILVCMFESIGVGSVLLGLDVVLGLGLGVVLGVVVVLVVDLVGCLVIRDFRCNGVVGVLVEMWEFSCGVVGNCVWMWLVCGCFLLVWCCRVRCGYCWLFCVFLVLVIWLFWCYWWNVCWVCCWVGRMECLCVSVLLVLCCCGRNCWMY